MLNLRRLRPLLLLAFALGCGTSTVVVDGAVPSDGMTDPDGGTLDMSDGGDPGGTCDDGLRNQDESDVDCGGVCGATCAMDALCGAAADCMSGFCSDAGRCAPPPSCDDGEQNQDESDVDCGGVCGATCRPDEMCGDAGDCTTALCEGGICQPMPTCDDGVLNGTESDVDCGGEACLPCPTGGICAEDGDCASAFCDAGTCEDPVCGNGVAEGPEGCDDGVDGAPTESASCDVDCSLAECGDGLVNVTASETCDGDGAGTGGETETCDIDCTVAECGDGLVNLAAMEACDGDGAGTGGETAACNVDCTLPACGDGTLNVSAGEECDDGNTAGGDGCEADCRFLRIDQTIPVDSTFDTDLGTLNGIPVVGWNAETGEWLARNWTLAIGATLTIAGSAPLQVVADLDVTVDGTLDAAGEDGSGAGCNVEGGDGGAGGPGAGAGGAGGGQDVGGVLTLDGAPGAGPGGGGGGTGDNQGGGGAGHIGDGEAGVGDPDSTSGAPGAAGPAYVLPLPLQGGSGGGGGSVDDDAPLGTYDPGVDDGGGGGGGGGGAIRLESVGGVLEVTGVVDVRGGDGGSAGCAAAAGGAGSGGWVQLFTSMAEPEVAAAAFLLEGGTGGSDGFVDNTAFGGDGAPGRLEIGVRPFCSDGLLNQDESGIDCGGSVCGLCANRESCRDATDCTSGTCDVDTCVAATCLDGLVGGTETDLDCGGADCRACSDGDTCLAPGDCASGLCDASVCVSCVDGVANADETDVDCGGPVCDACPGGLACVAPTDCVSGSCTMMVCDSQPGRLVLVGHDYFNRNASVDTLLGNVVASAEDLGTIDVLIYDEFADTTATGEVNNLESAIEDALTTRGRTVSFTRLDDSADLATTLTASVDVFLIAEQENGFVADFATIASSWSADLVAFLGRGGVLAVTSWQDQGFQLVSGPGLITVADTAILTNGSTLTVTAASSPVTAGIGPTYASPNGSARYTGLVGGTTLVETGAGQPVVVEFLFP
ncbi:MAG: hypothetical protein AAF447_14105 [Myxococcota bacterium]